MATNYSRDQVLDIIEREAQERRIPRDQFLRFAYIETGGNFNELASRGAAGAKGLFQFTPGTAAQYGIAGRELDAVANTDAAARLYLDNRKILVNQHERDSRPYLSGKPEPDGLDMYIAHQQGAAGYRSIQAALETGSFRLDSTRDHILNNVGNRDLRALTGVSPAAFEKMSDRDMAQTFVRYWDTKMDRIRIPEKGIEPVNDKPSMRSQQTQEAPAKAQQGTEQQKDKITLNSAYKLTKNHDDVEYAINVKGSKSYRPGVDGKTLSQGYIDCSGWVATLQNETMKEINEEAGRTVFGKSEMFNLGNDGAAMIVKKAQERSGVLIEGKAVTADKLKEGMIIGEDTGYTKFDKGRFKGIDHITMVVRDPKDGQLKISQSRSGEGVELVSLDSYLDRKQARGVKLYASDPLAEARDLLQDRAQGKQQGKGDQEHTQGKQHEKGEREHKPVRPQAPAEHSGVLRQQDLGDLNTDLQKLQQTLQKLGYKDAQGQALKTDGSFDDGTGEAVKAFQRAHGLQANGIVGRDTLSALKQAEKSPLLSEKTNPDHPLYSQAVSKLEQLGPQAFANRRQLENTAGSLAFEAKVSGMQHIDVVIQSKDGSGLFAVEGNPNDPAQKRIYTDKSAAAENSLAQSSNALRQDVQVQDHQEQKRAQAR